MDTRPNPTLMGQILPNPIKNRVGYGFKKKNLKQVWVGSRFYQKLSPKPGPNLDSDPVTLKLQKNPYIYIVVNPNHPSLISAQASNKSTFNLFVTHSIIQEYTQEHYVTHS